MDFFDFKNGLGEFFHAWRSGKRVDSLGREKLWTNDELDQIVTNTKRKIQEGGLFAGAPFVVGHPTTDAPAYGWVGDLKRDGDTLLLKGDKIQDEFSSGVKEGRWPNRSIRIGKDDHGFFLQHVGFLGAAPPSVKGMPATYSADDCEHYDYALDTQTPNALQRMMRRVREFIIDKFDIETANTVIPDYEIDVLTDHVNALRNEDSESLSPTSTSFNESTGESNMPGEFTQADIDAAVTAARSDERNKAQTDFSTKETDLQSKLEAERRTRRSNEFSAQVESLVASGNVTPAQREGMADFMLTLSDGDDAQFEFSAGDGDKKQVVKKSPLAWFQEFTKSIGKQIDLGESDAGTSLEGSASAADFVAAHGGSVDAERLALHQKALDYQSKHDGIDYISAVRIVEQ